METEETSVHTPIDLIPRSDTGLSGAALTSLEGQLDALASLCERDGKNTVRLFFTCLSALTAGHVDEPSVRGLLGCLLGSRAWSAIHEDLTAARYAAQLLLQRLMERGLVDAPLLTAGLNRLGGNGAQPCPAQAALADCLLRRREELAPADDALPSYVEDALRDAGLSPKDRLSYSGFIHALASDGGWLYRRLAAGRRTARLPGGHLLPLAGAELLLRLDGEKRPAMDALLERLNRHARCDPESLRQRLLNVFILRHAPLAADALLSCRDLLTEFFCCLDAAAREGLFVPDGQSVQDTPAAPLSWETRVFRAAGGLTAGGWGYGSGRGSGFAGSGRSGSGFGSGRFGSGRFGSGFGSGRLGSGFGSGRYGSGGSTAAALGMGAFAGCGPEDGLGGVYGLELIDAPLTEEQAVDQLLALLADGAL